MSKKKIGLALGSGGAKGLSHIGVIKVLHEAGIKFDYIAGSSIGALIGGAYACCGDISKIEEEVINSNWKKIFALIDPVFKGGLIGGIKVKKFIENYTQRKDFSDLGNKLAIVATDFDTGDPVVITKGDIATAIRASISFPLLFKPVKIDNKTLADGGLSTPVPVNIVREMGADIVIAVNLDGSYFKSGKKIRRGYYDTANDSINILKYHLANYNIKRADIVITPQTGDVKWNKFADGGEITLSGELAAKKNLKKIRDMIS